MSAIAEQAPPPAATGADPLAGFDLDALIAGAARLRPERIAFSDAADDDARMMTFADVEGHILALAHWWREARLAPGQRVLLVGGASTATTLCALALLRAGVDAALAPAHLPPATLAKFARDVGAVTMVGEARCGDIELALKLFETAASAPDVRFVATVGAQPADGAVHLDEHLRSTQPLTPAARPARLLTRDRFGRVWHHRQRTLVAATFDFVSRARIGAHLPIVTTILPTSFAGLVVGPLAGLIAGAPTVLHGPFDAQRLAAIVEALHPVHLVLPAQAAAQHDMALTWPAGRLASLALLHRHDSAGDALACAPDKVAHHAGAALFDVHAIGESAVLSEPRDAQGAAATPTLSQHMLTLNGSDTLVAGVKRHYLATDGGSGQQSGLATTLEGLAISECADD